MKHMIGTIGLSAGVFFSAGIVAASPTITLQPVHPAASSNVAVAMSCRTPNAAAAIAGDPFLEVPAIAQLQDLTGSSVVKIRLSHAGRVIAESIFESSENPYLDKAALLSARWTSYTPETRNCAAVDGDYLYEVDF